MVGPGREIVTAIVGVEHDLGEVPQLEGVAGVLDAVLLLGGSALLFTGAGKRTMSRDAMSRIVPICLFHELPTGQSRVLVPADDE